ncbi:MAG: hypothetical protein ABIE14_00350 [Patescibacteria group bacterium]
MQNKNHKTHPRFELSGKPERLIFLEKPTGQDLVNAMSKTDEGVDWQKIKKALNLKKIDRAGEWRKKEVKDLGMLSEREKTILERMSKETVAVVKEAKLKIITLEKDVGRGEIEDRITELNKKKNGEEISKEELAELLREADEKVDEFKNDYRKLDNVKLKKVTLTGGEREKRNLFRTYTFDKIEDFLKSEVASKKIEATEASRILEVMMSGMKVKNKSTGEVLWSSMRMVQYVDFLPDDIKKRFKGKDNKADLAKEMEAGGQNLTIAAGGVVEVGGKKYQIKQFETLIGAAMSKIEAQLTGGFKLKNLLIKDGVALAQMENGCGGNLVALQLEEKTEEVVLPKEKKEKSPVEESPAFVPNTTLVSTFETNPKLKLSPENPWNLPGYLFNAIRSLGLIPAKGIKNLAAWNEGVEDYSEKSTNFKYDGVEYDKDGNPIYNERLKNADHYYKIREINTAETLAEILGFKNGEGAKEFLKNVSTAKLAVFIKRLPRARKLATENANAKQKIKNLKKAEGDNEKEIRNIEQRTAERHAELEQLKSEFAKNEKMFALANYIIGQQIVDLKEGIAPQKPLEIILNRIEHEEMGHTILDFENDEKNATILDAKMERLELEKLPLPLAEALEMAGIIKIKVRVRKKEAYFEINPEQSGFKNVSLREALKFAKGEKGLNLGYVEFVNVLDLKLGDPKLVVDHFDLDVLNALEVLGIAEIVKTEKEVADGYDSKNKKIEKTLRGQQKLKVLDSKFKDKTISEVFEYLKEERQKAEKTIKEGAKWQRVKGGGLFEWEKVA